ncbi:DUF5335 domain-containing protein [Sphingomonas sp. 179-I 2A4 NHS]|uniref:DUF5335 domain-containing protein n=1 Tax=unclassified Sphingomonas TaxID=196159 RepID=UPI002329D479|nr:hypothetical protein GCM10017606_24110 [Microbacterium terregens]
MNVVPKAEWSEYLNRASRAMIGLRAEIEVASLELGDQIEAQYLPITGIFYDHKDDLVGVTLEGLDHMIRHPQSIYVEASPDGLSAIAVIDRDGTNHLIKLKRPLALPAPDQ